MVNLVDRKKNDDLGARGEEAHEIYQATVKTCFLLYHVVDMNKNGWCTLNENYDYPAGGFENVMTSFLA